MYSSTCTLDVQIDCALVIKCCKTTYPTGIIAEISRCLYNTWMRITIVEYLYIYVYKYWFDLWNCEQIFSSIYKRTYMNEMIYVWNSMHIVFIVEDMLICELARNWSYLFIKKCAKRLCTPYYYKCTNKTHPHTHTHTHPQTKHTLREVNNHLLKKRGPCNTLQYTRDVTNQPQTNQLRNTILYRVQWIKLYRQQKIVSSPQFHFCLVLY